MAALILDLQHTAVFVAGNTFGTAVSSTGGLTSVDLNNDVGNRISAYVTSTAVAGSGTASIQIQESADNSTWASVTGPNTTNGLFTTITAANASQVISFNVTARYFRGFCTITGTSVTLQLTFIYAPKMTPVGTAGGWVNEAYSNP